MCAYFNMHKKRKISMAEFKTKKKDHNIVEQERRNKERKFFEEFAQYLPVGRRFDKLQTLNMITEIIRARENERRQLESSSVIPSNEFNRFVLDAIGGFFMMINCKTGQVVSTVGNLQQMLQYDENEWVNRNIFEFLHPNDCGKFQSSFLSNEITEISRIPSLSELVTTKIGKKTIQVRAQRALLCRVKHKGLMNYSTVHITGYTHCPGHESFFLATVRLFSRIHTEPEPSSAATFITRHDKNGKLTFIDKNLQVLLGYNPDERLLGNHLMNICVDNDQPAIIDMLNTLYDDNSETVRLQLNFKTKKNDKTLRFHTQARNCLNGFNDQFVFIIAEHSLEPSTSHTTFKEQELLEDDNETIDENYFAELFQLN